SRMDGRHPYCRKCTRLKPRSEKQKEAARIRSHKWYKENQDRVTEYYADDKVKAHRKEYMKEWRRVNARRVREYSVKYDQNRCSEDPTYKLSVNLRKRLGVAIRNGQKAGSAVR